MRWFVPGRIEVFGKHTDYAGGHSLVAAVPRGITVTAQPSHDGRVVIEDPSRNLHASFTARGEGPSEGWCAYPASVIRRLARNFPSVDLAARVEFSSDLPQASGISSSSALVIAIAEALIACAGLEDTPEWQAAIRTPEERAAYFSCLENGGLFRGLDGDAGVGTLGGSEDHAAILMSRPGHLQLFSYCPVRRRRFVPMVPGWTFVVAFTGVAAQKAGNAMARYNLAASQAAAIAEAWRARHPGDGRTLAEIGREALALALPPDLAVRLEHFLGEDARAVEAAEAFDRADVPRIAELAAASQREAARLLGNQAAETAALVEIALAHGAAAATGFGAGWGGSVWALARAADAPAFLAAWLRAYQTRYPHLAADGFISYPSAGLFRL